MNKFIPTVATIHHPITVDRKIAVRSVSATWKKMKEWRWYSFLDMQKRVARMLSHIIAVSHQASEDIYQEFNVPKDRFRIVPNGINTDIFYPIPDIQREKNRIITTNSADIPLKGLDYLLKALAAISNTRDIKLTVIGAPKKNGDIQKLIRQLGIGKHVEFTGRIDNHAFVRHYAKATVAVVPSVYEGFGLPAGEAMACGVPVIATTGGALPEVIGDAGLLVPPADPPALAHAITSLLDNPEHANVMGKAGFKRVQNNFTWKSAAEKTVQVYKEAIRDHGRF